MLPKSTKNPLKIRSLTICYFYIDFYHYHIGFSSNSNFGNIKNSSLFSMDFNDFLILWGHLEASLGKCFVTLALFWVYDGGFGSPFDHFGASLGTRCVYVGAWA